MRNTLEKFNDILIETSSISCYNVYINKKRKCFKMSVFNFGFYLFIAFTVFLVVGSIYEIVSRKRLVKDMNEIGEKYHIVDCHELEDKGKKYYLSYFLLKPEWYEKIKSTGRTSVGFNIDTAYVQFARVDLMNEDRTIYTSLYIPCYKLRNELEEKDLELLEQIKKFNLSDENYAILKSDLEKQLKEKELLKDY